MIPVRAFTKNNIPISVKPSRFVKPRRFFTGYIIFLEVPYMFYQMNNLILDGRIKTNSIEAMIFKETDEGTQAIKMPIHRFGIDDKNFVETSEKFSIENFKSLRD
jgi:hypothetical protein